jgi:hypothetical protein
MADFVNALFGGMQQGRAMRERDDQLAQQALATQRQNKLAALAGDAFAAPPGAQRDTALSTAMRLDPNAGVALQGAVRTDEDARNQSLANMARLLTTAPEPSRPGLYQQMRPSLQRLGVQAPEQYDDTVAQTAQAIAQAFGGSSQSPGEVVQSTYINDQGQRVAIMRDGSQRVLGGADSRTQLVDVPGVGPQVVDLRNATASTVTRGPVAGQPAPAMPGLGGGPMPNANPQPGGVNISLAGMEPASIAETIGQIEANLGRRLTQQEIAQAFASGAGRPAPASAGGPQAVQPGPRPAATANPPRAVLPPTAEVGGGDPAWVRPTSETEVRPLSAAEIASAGLPEGTVAQVDQNGRITVLRSPNAQEARASRDAAAKLPRAQAALRRVDRVQAAVEALSTNSRARTLGADGGLIDQYLQIGSPEADELEQAASQLVTELTALTRIPGVGSQSDLETRLANLQLPSPRWSPEVNRRAVEEIRTLVTDIYDAMQNVAAEGGTAPATAQAGGGGGSSVATVNTEAEYAALPSGATFIDAQDGRIYRKP